MRSPFLRPGAWSLAILLVLLVGPDSLRAAPITRDTVPLSRWVFDVHSVHPNPEVRNQDEIATLMDLHYPPALRRGRISGTAWAHFVVREDGTVDPSTVRIERASHPELREPTQRVVEQFRFDPGRYHGLPVPVLLFLPVIWPYAGGGPPAWTDQARPGAGVTPPRVEIMGTRASSIVTRARPVPGRQPTIAGRVRDDAGNPIRGAMILLPSARRSAATDANGSFELEAEVGEHAVEVLVPAFPVRVLRASVRVPEQGTGWMEVTAVIP